jgi:hypothetical protein
MKKYITIACLACLGIIAQAQDWHWEFNDDLLNPHHIYTEGMNTPFTGDFDDDSDIDLIVGCRGGVLQYYENIGTPDSAIWQMDNDYFTGIDLDTSYAPQPSLVDLDGDEVDELYLSFQDGEWGYPAGNLTCFVNEGTLDDPVWVQSEFDIGYNLLDQNCHQFIDYDSDGDYDF